MKDMMKKMSKMKKESMSSPDKRARMSVLEDLKKQAQEAMGDKLHGMKKVAVMSDSKQGLEQGLDKAKELLDKKMPEGEQMPEEQEMSEESEEEMSEEPMDKAEEMQAMEALSPEEIDEKIAMLEEVKARKMIDHPQE